MFTRTMPYQLAVFIYSLRFVCLVWIKVLPLLDLPQDDKMTGGRDATLKAGRGVKDQLKTAVKKSAMMLSILAYKHLKNIFYFTSSVLAVAFSSLAAIPFQAILGELRDIFLRCGCWSLDFTQSGHLLAKCKHLWPITSSCKTLFRQ